MTAIDIGVIADGLSRHAWREPQLAALQEQLEKINFVSDIKQAMLAGPARVSRYLSDHNGIQLGGIMLRKPLPAIEKTNAWEQLKATARRRI